MKKSYSKNNIKLKWIVYWNNFNSNKFETFNIFEHYRFKDSINTLLSKCETKDEFSKKVQMELMYNFWSKSEYEIIITCKCERIFVSPWLGNESYEIDVTNDPSFDWVGFYEYTNHKIFKDCIKVDIYDQVMYRYDEFLNYLWNYTIGFEM